VKNVVIMFALLAVSGCASIVDGPNQSLSVKTISGGTDVAGAQCALTNNKGSWFVTTPGTVTVHRSFDNMNVKCDRDGFIANGESVSSATKGMVFGNLLFGGLIGVGVDIGTGAAYDYPSLIVLDIQPAKSAKSEGIPTS
jgi:hypothetical protein